MNVCSYHLQEAGATPVQEIAYSLATAIGVLDAVRESGQVAPEQFAQVFGSISFFVNAGIRFVEEICKLRAFTELWDRIGLERYGVSRRAGPPIPLRRAGQLARPHRGATREQRAAHRVGDAGRHAVEAGPGAQRAAPGVERSARAAAARGISSGRCECNRCWRSKPTCSSTTTSSTARRSSRRAQRRSVKQPWAELTEVLDLGGAFEAIDELKGRLVRSMVERTRRIESGQQQVVGVNVFTETAESPLGGPGNFLIVDPAVEAEVIDDVVPGEQGETSALLPTQCRLLTEAAIDGTNMMAPSIALARVGGTTGEWAAAARGVRRVPCADRCRRPRSVAARRSRRGRRAGQSDARWATAFPGRQAGPRRALQRCRADRRRRPRCRDGSRLLGHPPDRRPRSSPRHATRTPT